MMANCYAHAERQASRWFEWVGAVEDADGGSGDCAPIAGWFLVQHGAVRENDQLATSNVWFVQDSGRSPSVSDNGSQQQFGLGRSIHRGIQPG